MTKMRQSTKLVALAAFVLCMAGFLVLIYRKKIPEPVSAAPVGIQLREQEKYMKLAAQFVPSGFDESKAVNVAIKNSDRWARSRAEFKDSHDTLCTTFIKLPQPADNIYLENMKNEGTKTCTWVFVVYKYEEGTKEQLLRDFKLWKEAYEIYGEAVARFPDEADLRYDQAMMAEKAGKPADMEVLLRALIEAKPDFHHAYNALGYSLADRNVRLPEAKKLIEKAVELAPGDAYIQDSLGWVEFRLGNTKRALEILQAAYGKRPDPEIAAHLGEVLWSQGQRDQALKVWREGLLLSADNETLQGTLKRLRVKP